MKPYFETELGQLYCGDCLDIMLKLDCKVDLIVTSPPYWNARKYMDNSKELGQSDYLTYLNDLTKRWSKCCEILNYGCRLVINMGEIFYHLPDEDYVVYTAIFVDIFKQLQSIPNMRFAGKILWCKGTNNENAGVKSGKSFYGSYPYPPNLLLTNCQENLMVWRKSGKRTYKDVSIRISNQSKIDKDFIHNFTRPVWYINPAKDKSHPAVFPLEIPYKFIKAYSFVNDTILDPFIGSGKTAVACEKLNRRWIGIEISEGYCEIAKRRIKAEADQMKFGF